MSEPEPQRRLRGPPLSLYKQNSWSPDILRDEAWINRAKNHRRRRRGRSVTDDDLDELRGCIDLGFDFDSPELDPKLSSTFPALEFYYAVNHGLSRSSSDASFSDSDSASSGSPVSIVNPGDDPATVKARLRQWAQVVAYLVRKSS